MRYRILKYENHYLAQVKKWYGWVTVEDGGYDDLGEFSYPMRFKSEQEIHDYFKQEKDKGVVVWSQ